MGEDWDVVLKGGYYYRLAVESFPPHKVYVVSGWPDFTTSYQGIHVSEDGGRQWDYLGLAGKNLTTISLNPDNPKNIFVGGDDGIFRTDNGGLSWEPANTGIPSPVIRSLALDPTFPDRVYAGTKSTGVYRTDNGGDSWAAVLQGLLDLNVCEVMADPMNSGHVYAGTQNRGLFVSGNRGNYWQSASPVFMNTKTQALAILEQPTRRLITGGDRGILIKRLSTEPVLVVHFRSGEVGDVNKTLTSQLLPSTYLTLNLEADLFPDASNLNPMIIELKLPQGAILNQTIATGDLQTVAPWPNGDDQVVVPLAVSEYAFNRATSKYEPIEEADVTASIPFGAVQILRYVAGEDAIWIRVTEPTEFWRPDDNGHFIGVTIGLGGGVWPVVESSNWGSSGQYYQENTQFFVDLREYDFPSGSGGFPVTFSVFPQGKKATVEHEIDPPMVSLFKPDRQVSNQLFANSRVASNIDGLVQADLNLDCIVDICSLDIVNETVSWSFALPDGSFTTPFSKRFSEASPIAISCADVTNDGRPDLLLSTMYGDLDIFPWEDIFAPWAKKSAGPRYQKALPGVPSASTTIDLDQDGFVDFLYTDLANENLTIAWGFGFDSVETYACGEAPLAIKTGDFNGDSRPDVVVANSGSHSVSVYLNQGAGLLSGTEYTAGSDPLDVKTADFNRDGRQDIALVFNGNKSVSAWRAEPNGTFPSSKRNSVFFQNQPSAIAADNFDGLNGADLLVGFSDDYMLALCASDPLGFISYSFSLNTLGDVELDPVNHVTLNEDNVLSMGSGTSFGGVSNRNGVAALGQLSLNLIHFPRSRDLSFSVVNLGESSALFNLEMYGDAGDMRQSVTASVNSRAQYVRYLSDSALFGPMAQQGDQWVRAFLTQGNTHGFWLANESATLTYLDGMRMPDVRDALTEMVLPASYLGGDNFTDVMLINPYQETASALLTVRGQGTTKINHSRQIPGRGRLLLDLETEYPSMTADDFVHIQSDRPLIGMQLFGDSQRLAGLEAMSPMDDTPRLVGPHVASGDFGIVFKSRLVLVNSSASSVLAYIRLVMDDGSSLGPIQRSLGADSRNEYDLDDLFQLSSATTGYLTVDFNENAADITGYIAFGEAGDGRFLSTLPLLTIGGGKFLVGHMANGSMGPMTFFTGIAIVNPDPEEKTVRLDAYDQNGVSLDSQSLVIPANQRRVFLLHDVMTGLQNIFGGYMLVEEESGGDLLVFTLFGDTAYDFLSAVPAVNLPD